MKRNVPKEIKSIARERVGRVKNTRVIVPKTERKEKLCYYCELPKAACCCSWGPTYERL